MRSRAWRDGFSHGLMTREGKGATGGEGRLRGQSDTEEHLGLSPRKRGWMRRQPWTQTLPVQSPYKVDG